MEDVLVHWSERERERMKRRKKEQITAVHVGIRCYILQVVNDLSRVGKEGKMGKKHNGTWSVEIIEIAIYT